MTEIKTLGYKIVVTDDFLFSNSELTTLSTRLLEPPVILIDKKESITYTAVIQYKTVWIFKDVGSIRREYLIGNDFSDYKLSDDWNLWLWNRKETLEIFMDNGIHTTESVNASGYPMEKWEKGVKIGEYYFYISDGQVVKEIADKKQKEDL